MISHLKGRIVPSAPVNRRKLARLVMIVMIPLLTLYIAWLKVSETEFLFILCGWILMFWLLDSVIRQGKNGS